MGWRSLSSHSGGAVGKKRETAGVYVVAGAADVGAEDQFRRVGRQCGQEDVGIAAAVGGLEDVGAGARKIHRAGVAAHIDVSDGIERDAPAVVAGASTQIGGNQNRSVDVQLRDE